MTLQCKVMRTLLALVCKTDLFFLPMDNELKFVFASKFYPIAMI